MANTTHVAWARSAREFGAPASGKWKPQAVPRPRGGSVTAESSRRGAERRWAADPMQEDVEVVVPLPKGREGKAVQGRVFGVRKLKES